MTTKILFRPPKPPRELNISSRSLRRLAEAGKIPRFRTPGGYVRVRRRDLDAFKSLSSSIVPTVPSRVDSAREEVQMLMLDHQKRRLRSDLQRFEEEEAAKQAPSRAAIEQAAREREEREQRDKEEAARRDGKSYWFDWLQIELHSLPPDVPLRIL